MAPLTKTMQKLEDKLLRYKPYVALMMPVVYEISKHHTSSLKDFQKDSIKFFLNKTENIKRLKLKKREKPSITEIARAELFKLNENGTAPGKRRAIKKGVYTQEQKDHWNNLLQKAVLWVSDLEMEVYLLEQIWSKFSSYQEIVDQLIGKNILGPEKIVKCCCSKNSNSKQHKDSCIEYPFLKEKEKMIKNEEKPITSSVTTVHGTMEVGEYSSESSTAHKKKCNKKRKRKLKKEKERIASQLFMFKTTTVIKAKMQTEKLQETEVLKNERRSDSHCIKPVAEKCRSESNYTISTQTDNVDLSDTEQFYTVDASITLSEFDGNG